MKKNYFLFAILALIMFRANAQPPTAAPTPTLHAAADVISVFSGAYTNLLGTDFYPNWGQGTVVSDLTVSGDAMKKYDMLDYEGTQFASNINASSMSNLHFDIWTANCTAFEFYLVNTTTSAEQKVTVNPTASGWNSFDIDLTQYSAGIVSNIGQFKFQDNPFHYHTSTTVVYLDNIYFWKSASTPTISGFTIPAKYVGDAAFKLTAPTSNSAGAFTYSSSNTSVATINGDSVTIIGLGSSTITANQAADGSFGTGSTSTTLTVSYPPPATAAIAPTHLQTNVISVYSDTYTSVSGTNFYPNWGQSTTITNISISGNATIKYDNLNYEGMEFASSLNVASMQNLHFDIWTPNCSSLDFYLINIGIVEQKVTVHPTLSGWNSFDIPLSSYTAINLANVGQFKLVGNNGSTIYLDNIYFWKSASTPNITGFSVAAKNLGDAAFALTAPSSNSAGAFTYTSSNTAVATISGNMVTIVGVGNTTITATQAADGSFTAGSTSAVLAVSYPPPSTAAPDPTRDAADVLSIFSGVYTNISGTDFFPNWGQSTQVSDISVAGNTTKRYQNLNYQGIQFASPVNASALSELHLDLWTPNCTAFDVYLINAGGVEQKVTLNPTASGWNSFDISLSSYTTINKAAIIQFKLVGTPSGSSSVYLDNIYFWKATPVTLGTFTIAAKEVGDAAFALIAPSSNSSGAFTFTSSNTAVATISGNMVTIIGAGTSTITASQAPNGVYGSASTTASLVVTYPLLPPVPLTAAATPTKPSNNVISLFSNAYNNVAGTDFFPNWGQSTQVADTMIEGNTTKKYTNLNYQGIQFSGTIDASAATYLHLDIWTSTCTAFDVYLINTVTGAEQPVTLHPTLGGWNSYDIALSQYNANIVNHVNQIKLVGTPFGSSKVYLDNLYFWANSCLNHVADPFVSLAASDNNVCANTTVSFTATPTLGGTAPNYNFIVNGVSKQNGNSNVYTSNNSANNDIVTCTITRTDGCANIGNSNVITMIVKATPAVPLFTNGATQNCILGTTTNLNANAWTGSWGNSNPAVATISAGTTGANSIRVTAVSNGTTTISFTVTNSATGCASAISTNYAVGSVSVNPIICNSSACVGAATFAATNTTAGGVWASENNRVSISNTGIVTPTSVGSGLISYKVTDNTTGCYTKVTKSITINALPAIPFVNVSPAIGNTNAICSGGRVYTFTGTPSGGVWASSNPTVCSFIGSVMTTGNTTGVSTTISYTVTGANGCSNARSFTGKLITCFARETNTTNDLKNSDLISVYPNPAKSFIILQGKNIASIQIINSFGHIAMAKQIDGATTSTINIQGLSTGLYLVKTTDTNGAVKTEKLIIN